MKKFQSILIILFVVISIFSCTKKPSDNNNNNSLIANFTISDSVISTGSTISFTDISTGNPTDWHWSFEGAYPSESYDQNPTDIEYDEAGTFEVRLFVQNNNETAEKTRMVRVVQTAILPTITTSTMSSITTNSAGGGGNITSAGSSAVIARGVCWSTTTNPTVANSKSTDGAGTGSFTSTITSLSSNTTYFVRAYATNAEGTAYGNQQSFTTSNATIPVISTTSISNITESSATCGGNVISDGGSIVTARGICWSISPNPTIITNTSSNGTGIGSFTNTLINLSPGTTYHVRAYATNNTGTSYGSDVPFNTSNSGSIFNPDATYGTMRDLDFNVYKTIQIGSQVWMAENLRTMVYNDGTRIAWGLTPADWQSNTSGAFYGINNTTYGKQYNWYAVKTGKLAPTGWHIPSEAEWTILINNLNAASAGGKMKSTSSLWRTPNTGSNNISGFSGLPGGYYSYAGSTTGDVGNFGYWWSSTEGSTGYALSYNLGYNTSSVGRNYSNTHFGFSVRCVKN